MSSPDLIGYAFLAALTGVMLARPLWEFVGLLKKLRTMRKAEAFAEPSGEVLPPPSNPNASSQWHPMPCGTRIELSATGFYISLNTADATMPYHGHTPEGAQLIQGNNLATVKAFMERAANDRAEFAPPAIGWKKGAA